MKFKRNANLKKNPINLWIDLVAVTDFSYFKFFNEHSAWYEIDSLSSREQVTYLIETYIAHVINGVFTYFLLMIIFTKYFINIKMAMRFTENLKDDEDFRININLMGIIVATVFLKNLV